MVQIIDPIYNLGSAVLLNTCLGLEKLSQKVVETAAIPFRALSDYYGSIPPPAPATPPLLAAPPLPTGPYVFVAHPAHVKVPRVILHPLHDPIMDTLNDCLTGNFQTRGVEDFEANLNMLYTLTFRRECTEIPQRMAIQETAREYCARQLVSSCVMHPSLLPRDRSSLPRFLYEKFDEEGRTFIGMLIALRIQYRNLPVDIFEVKQKFDLEKPLDSDNPRPEDLFLTYANAMVTQFAAYNPAFAELADAVRQRYLETHT